MIPNVPNEHVKHRNRSSSSSKRYSLISPSNFIRVIARTYEEIEPKPIPIVKKQLVPSRRKILFRPDPCVAVEIVPAMVISLTEPWTGKDNWYSGRVSFNVLRRTPLSQWISRLTWSISMIRLKCFIEIKTSLHIDNDDGEWPQPITLTFQPFVVTSFRVDRSDSIDVGSTYNRGRHENVRAQFQNSGITTLIFGYWSLRVQKVATLGVRWWCKALGILFFSLFFLSLSMFLMD